MLYERAQGPQALEEWLRSPLVEESQALAIVQSLRVDAASKPLEIGATVHLVL
jgi:hypothetical protein